MSGDNRWANNPDFDTVVIRKKQTAEEAARAGNVESVKRVTHGPKDVDPHEEGAKPIARSNTTVGQQIQAGRTAKGWTQKELDQKCNFPTNTVNKYENGSAVINHDQLNKMRKCLGIKIDTSTTK